VSDELREVPVQIHCPDGGTIPARIVTPAWTPDELVSMVRTQVRDALARSQESGRDRAAAHADRVLGPGTAERARKALAAERHNPWADPYRPGRSR
jgi:hypothetical protein